jgi:hypothetical protein
MAMPILATKKRNGTVRVVQFGKLPNSSLTVSAAIHKQVDPVLHYVVQDGGLGDLE